jgi:hypothetical protein
MKSRTKQKLLISLAALPGFGALSTALAYSQIPRFPVPLSLSEQAAVLLDAFWKVIAGPYLFLIDAAVFLILEPYNIPRDYIYISLTTFVVFLSWLGLVFYENAHPASVMVPIALWTLIGGGLTYVFIFTGI